GVYPLSLHAALPILLDRRKLRSAGRLALLVAAVTAVGRWLLNTHTAESCLIGRLGAVHPVPAAVQAPGGAGHGAGRVHPHALVPASFRALGAACRREFDEPETQTPAGHSRCFLFVAAGPRHCRGQGALVPPAGSAADPVGAPAQSRADAGVRVAGRAAAARACGGSRRHGGPCAGLGAVNLGARTPHSTIRMPWCSSRSNECCTSSCRAAPDSESRKDIRGTAEAGCRKGSCT